MKNVLGFCLSYWIFKVALNPNLGFVAVYMVQFAVDMLPIVLAVPLYVSDGTTTSPPRMSLLTVCAGVVLRQEPPKADDELQYPPPTAIGRISAIYSAWFGNSLL
jgi:hypothetical protein